MTTRQILAVVALGGLLTASCASGEPESKRAIIVPSSATSAPEYQGDGAVPSQRYVIRMSDGSRDWEVEFPDTATGYEMRIPLKSGASAPGMQWEEPGMTDADQQLLDQLRRGEGEFEGQGVFRDGQNVTNPDGQNNSGGALPGAELNDKGKQIKDPGKADPGASGGASPSRPSYLLGIEEVSRMYKSGNYELAMVRLVQLEKAYPNDVRLLSMKGTLWLKLGREELAREAWEQALQIDPDDRSVIEALKRLNTAQDR
jgi:hypothetical protein